MPRDRPTALFIVLGGFFICNALIAEFIGIKIFALEASLGLPPFDWNLFGQQGSLSFTAGVLVWPVVFVMTVYKFTAAVALTPMIYLARRVLERYLGPELATELKRRAAA